MSGPRQIVARTQLLHAGETMVIETVHTPRRERLPGFGLLFRGPLTKHATTTYLSLELRIIAALLQWSSGNGMLTAKMLAIATEATVQGVEKSLRKLVAAELVLSIGGGQLYRLSPLLYHCGAAQKWKTACQEMVADKPPVIPAPKKRGRRKEASSDAEVAPVV